MSTASFALLLLSFVAPADSALRRRTFREVHLGVEVRITAWAPNDSQAADAARQAFAEVARLEDVFSDWRPGSEARRLEGAVGRWQRISPELCDVLTVALRVARASDGAFDPTLGPLTHLWRAARARGVPPSPGELSAAREASGYRWLDLDTVGRRIRLRRAGMRLDLGGIAKGYILQQAVGVLARAGITSVLVEGGGDLVAGAPPPQQAGWMIAAPYADSALAARARALTHVALATSGPVEQFMDVNGRRESHIIDRATGHGVRSSRVATVIGTDAALVDATATALTVLPDRAGQRLLRQLGLVGSVLIPPDNGSREPAR